MFFSFNCKIIQSSTIGSFKKLFTIINGLYCPLRLTINSKENPLINLVQCANHLF